MNIQIVSGFGEGQTLLSAFDNALQVCGVFNYNLIPLSSIIPPETKIIRAEKYQPDGKFEYGHKLYVVKAENRSNEINKFIASGIGWYQREDGRGVFVEHEEKGEDKHQVEVELLLKIERSLHDLCRFRQIPFDRARMRKCISIGQVTDKASCALVLAVYKAEGWE